MKLNRPKVYVDGACPNNGAAKTAGVGVYFPNNPSCSFGEPLPDELAPFTNNRAEIYAAIRALEVTDGPITVYSDSKQVVKTMTVWLPKRIRDNWKGTKTSDLYLRLLELTQDGDVKFKWVPGHSGVPGNEAADQLATQACQD
jgi:ribonuclease HI